VKPLPRLLVLGVALAAVVALAVALTGGDARQQVTLVSPNPTPQATTTTSTTAPATTAVTTSTVPVTTAPVTTPVTGPPPEPGTAATAGGDTCRIAAPGVACGEPALPGCPDDQPLVVDRAAVVDKAAQRFWLCQDGVPVTDARPMTTASEAYGLPPVGTHKVFAKNNIAYGIHGETLHRFVAFYTTPRGNRIAFHQYVHQPEDTVGNLDRRGESSGCLRVTTDDSHMVWDFLQIGDPVVVITA